MRVLFVVSLFSILAACSSSSLPPAGLIAYSCVAGEAVHLMAFDPHPTRRAWATLGGSGQKGETPAQTAIREFTEESNCAYRSAELDASQMKGPSISPGVPFHLYTAQIPFKSVDEIAQTRQCVDIERSQWVWVRHLDLVRAINQHTEAAQDPLTVHTIQGQPAQVPLWSRGVESLKKALQDGVLPETINCSATQLS